MSNRRFAAQFHRTLKIVMDKTMDEALDFVKDHGAALLEELESGMEI